jgi:hypothetical protein
MLKDVPSGNARMHFSSGTNEAETKNIQISTSSIISNNSTKKTKGSGFMFHTS